MVILLLNNIYTYLVGVTVGLKNWLRVTFAVDPCDLEEGLDRIKAFSLRHAKKLS